MRSSNSLVLQRSSDSINVEYGMVWRGWRGQRSGEGKKREGKAEGEEGEREAGERERRTNVNNYLR